MAKLGIGILVIPQKPWPMIDAELATYRRIYSEVNGEDAPSPVIAGWVFCDEDESRAREEAVRWIGAYWQSAVRHYEIGGDHFAKTKGYEFYAQMSAATKAMAQSDGPDQATEAYLDLQVWGTPKMCTERILNTCERMGSETFVSVFSYAGMPYERAEQNLRLFAEKTLPELR